MCVCVCGWKRQQLQTDFDFFSEDGRLFPFCFSALSIAKDPCLCISIGTRIYRCPAGRSGLVSLSGGGGRESEGKDTDEQLVNPGGGKGLKHG